METYGMCRGTHPARHLDGNCQGQLAIDGMCTVRVPGGFGAVADPSGKAGLVVDSAAYPAFTGFCLRCKQTGTFVRVDAAPDAQREHASRSPLRRKIARYVERFLLVE